MELLLEVGFGIGGDFQEMIWNWRCSWHLEMEMEMEHDQKTGETPEASRPPFGRVSNHLLAMV